MITRTYTERKKKHKQRNLDDACLRCGLFEHANAPKLSRTKIQEGTAGRVLIVLSHPSQAEDIKTKIGGDSTGSTIKKYMKQYLTDCEVWITCSVKCYPREYQIKTHETRWCSSFLKEDMDTIKPNIVIAMGDLARAGCKELNQEYESSIHPQQLKEKALDRTIVESFSRTGAELRNELYPIPLSDSLDDVINEAIKDKFIGLDFEWNIETDVTHTVGFSSKTKCKAVIINKESKKILRELVSNPKLTIVGHNIVTDVIRLIKLIGNNIKCKFMDTLILKRQLAPHLPVGGLKFFAHNYLHLVDYAKDITIDDFAKSTKKLRDYCAGDAYAGLILYYMFKEDYPEYWNIMTPAREIDMEMIYPVATMINGGIKVDIQQLQSHTKKNNTIIDDLLQRINDDYGINPSSPAQVLETFQSLGYDIDSTGERILKAIDHNFARDILEYRKYSKLNTTYTTKIPEKIGKDGRLHCNLQLASTVTGRMSSSNPNMQNMPPGVRPCFQSIFADDGILLTVDASQSELRCLAYLSKSKYLIDSYNKGVDMHTLVSNLAKISRKNAKVLNFAYVYGATEFRLKDELIKAGVPVRTARTTVKNYMNVMSKIGISKYQKNLLTLAQKKGYNTSVYGRIGDRLNPTQIVNFPIQSFSADLNKIRIIQMFKQMRKEKLLSRIWLEFHDAMELDVYAPELDTVLKMLGRIDTQIPDVLNYNIKLDLPLDIKQHGKNWNEQI